MCANVTRPGTATGTSGLRHWLPVSVSRTDVRSALRLAPSPPRLKIAIKAAAAMALTLGGGLALTGSLSAGALASLGAFTVLYGPTTAARWRLRLMLAVGVGLVATAAIGAFTAPLGWIDVPAMALTGGVAALLCQALRLGPPGALFFVLVHGVAGLAASHGTSPGHIVALVTLGAVVATAIGMSDVVLDPQGPQRQAVEAADRAITRFEEAHDPDSLDEVRRTASAALHRAWTVVTDGGSAPRWTDRLWAAQERYIAVTARLTGARLGISPRPWESAPVNETATDLLEVTAPQAPTDRARAGRVEREQIRDTSLGRPAASFTLRRALEPGSETRLVAGRVAAATLLGSAAAMLVNNDHPYWAAATATLVLHQGGTRRGQTVRGLQRFVGTLLGLALFAAIGVADPGPVTVVALVAGLQFVVEMIVVRNYGYAVIAITPLALTISAHASHSTQVTLAADRALDTLIGVASALLVLWCSGRRRPELPLRAHGRRVVRGLDHVLADLASGHMETRAAREHRRRLYSDLLEADDVARRVQADAGDRVADYHAMQRSLTDLGYLVLGAAWNPDTRGARDQFAAAREPLAHILAHPVTEPRDAADIAAEVGAVEAVITDWPDQPDHPDRPEHPDRPDR